MAKIQKANGKRKQEEEEVEVVSSDSKNEKTKKVKAKKTEEVSSPQNNKRKKEKIATDGRSSEKGDAKKKKEKIDGKKEKIKVGKKDEIFIDDIKNNKKKSGLCSCPMNRVNRIIKSANSDIRMFSEAVFLVNKASEMFLELFSEEAYACACQDRKKKVAYKHLSSVIPKRRRFDFLSDFVPEKVKVEDALKEVPSVET